MTKEYYEMHSVQKTPISYKTGKSSGIIFHTMWNSLSQVGVKKAKQAVQKIAEVRGVSVSFQNIPQSPFVFLKDADIEWWNNYLVEINHTI